MLTSEEKDAIIKEQVKKVNHKIHGEGEIVGIRFDQYEKQYKIEVLFVTPDLFEEKKFPAFLYLNDPNLCQ